MTRSAFLLLLCAFLSLSTTSSAAGSRRVVCYFTNWAQYRPAGGTFRVTDVNSSLCTHLIFAFAKITGTTVQPYEFNDVGSTGTWRQFNNLKLTSPRLKTLLSIGGYTHGPRPFTAMVATNQTRADFISNAISLLRSYDFDGVDFDWEYPGLYVASDKEMFAIFLRELREAVQAEAVSTGRPELLVTAAASAGIARAETAYDVIAFNNYLDFVNVMTYDYHGPWENTTGLSAPLRGAFGDLLTMESTMYYYLNHGLSRDKAVIGLPAFGHTWSLADSRVSGIGAPGFSGLPGAYTRTHGFIAYYEVCSYLSRGMRPTRDPLGATMWGVFGSEWVSYDNRQTIADKMDWIISEGFGGAMMWALDEDDFAGRFCGERPYPLLNTIADKFANAQDVSTTPGESTSTTTKAATNPTAAPTPITLPTSTTTRINPTPTSTGMNPTSTTARINPTPTTTRMNPSTGSSTTMGAQTSASTANPSTPGPAQDFQCPELFGFFAHPTECVKYVVCFAGRPLVELRCPASYNFNPSAEQCQEDFVC